MIVGYVGRSIHIVCLLLLVRERVNDCRVFGFVEVNSATRLSISADGNTNIRMQ